MPGRHRRALPRLAILAALGACLFFGLTLGGCHDHECQRRDVRCHAGEMQECHCETVSGMIAANTCTEPARWRPVGGGVIGCIDTPDGPRGSRESCPDRGMGDFCEAERAVSCADSEGGQALAFATPCRDGESCQLDGLGKHARAVCAAAVPLDPPEALLLYATHPVEWRGSAHWAPARVAHDAELKADAGAVVVLLRADGVRAYRGGSIPIALQGTRVTWPRPALGRFLASPTPDAAATDAVASDAGLAVRFQAFFMRPLPHLAEVARSSALWHAGDLRGARAIIETALLETPDSEVLLRAKETVRGGN